MSETKKDQRVISILTAVFGNATAMAKQTGIAQPAAEKLMQTGELRLNEYSAIKRVTGLTSECFLGIQ